MIYKPHRFITFYGFLLPALFFHCNLLILIVFRKDFSTLKYFGIFCSNFFSMYFCYFVIDKKIFENYLKKVNPYSKFIREEFLKHKDEISEKSYKRVMEYDRKAKEYYEF